MKKGLKYRNIKCNLAIGSEYLKFDSIKEKDRYLDLLKLQASGSISNLERQKRFIVHDEFWKCDGCGGISLKKLVTCTFCDHKLRRVAPIVYIADFVYKENDRTIVEDVKGSDRIVTTDFKIKRKMLEYKYGVILRLFI